jgi:alkylhydroperoxidase family enzyme
MARVPYFDRADLPPEHQDLLNRPINLFRALVNSPGAARGWSGIGHYIRHGSKLDPRLRELAILQVGYVARSPYEYSHHVKIGHDFGVSDDDIRAIAAETQGRATDLEPLAKTVLKAAREMSTELAISDATFAHLREKLDTTAPWCASWRRCRSTSRTNICPISSNFRCRPPPDTAAHSKNVPAKERLRNPTPAAYLCRKWTPQPHQAPPPDQRPPTA